MGPKPPRTKGSRQPGPARGRSLSGGGLARGLESPSRLCVTVGSAWPGTQELARGAGAASPVRWLGAWQRDSGQEVDDPDAGPWRWLEVQAWTPSGSRVTLPKAASPGLAHPAVSSCDPIEGACPLGLQLLGARGLLRGSDSTGPWGWVLRAPFRGWVLLHTWPAAVLSVRHPEVGPGSGAPVLSPAENEGLELRRGAAAWCGLGVVAGALARSGRGCAGG